MADRVARRRPDLDALHARVMAAAAARRGSGEYPPDLDMDLREQFDVLAEGATAGGALEASLDRLAELTQVGRHRIDYSSTIPGGTRLHHAVGKLVVRQTDAVFAQVRELGVAVHAVLEQLASGMPDDVATLRSRVDAALDRLAQLERSGAGRVEQLERRLDELEQRLAALGATDSAQRP